MKRTLTQLAMLAAFLATALVTLGTRAPDVAPPTPHLGVAVAHTAAPGIAPVVVARFFAPTPTLWSVVLVDVSPPSPSSTTPIYLRDRVLRL